MLTQSTPKNPALLNNKQEKTGSEKCTEDGVVSPAGENFVQLKTRLAAEQRSQNTVSRQTGTQKGDSLGMQTTYTLDGMTVRTFDKMHVEILQLQDKIRFLENHLKTDQSPKN